MAEWTKLRPRNGRDVAGVALKHVEPMLGNTSHVEGGKADFLVFAGALGTEEVLTAV